VKFCLEGNEKPVLSLMSMKSLEENLPDTKFMRVHRSFIVNLDKIKTIERNRIVFGKEHIPISENYKEKFQKLVNERFF
jgi:DNA-binding LytR/AlgR family response regulator